jgi:hypothetical protein
MEINFYIKGGVWNSLSESEELVIFSFSVVAPR